VLKIASLPANLRGAPAFLRDNSDMVINLVVVTGAMAFMFSQGSGFAVRVAQVFTSFAILAVSLNLIVGYTGLLSVAHVAFYGIGAYAVGILTTASASEDQLTGLTGHLPHYAWPFFAALPVGMVFAGVVALFVGGVLSRFRDDIFVLVSFGFAIIMQRIFLNDIAIPGTDYEHVTRGPLGIHGIAKPDFFGRVIDGRIEFLFLSLGFLAIVFLISWLIVRSSFGRVLMAIREDEAAIEVFGYKAKYFKLTIWVISAMMAALAGALFASDSQYIGPESFVLLQSILFVSVVILGGLASLWGSLLGALVYVLLVEGMRFIPHLPEDFIGQGQLAILGIAIVVLMLFRPQGLVGKYKL
jgi:branched-chain amino acid transport system permease protein